MKKLLSVVGLTALMATVPAITTTIAAPITQDEIKAAEVTDLKAAAFKHVDGNAKLAQEIVDSLFSFSELAFQEFETQKYVSKILEDNGFTVEKGVSGLPSSWWATWSNGEGPTIAMGSDVDGIPKSSQMPGVAYRKPMVPGAPGHGEGHNSGNSVNIVAALAVKELMIKNNIKGTLVLWPGIAEELVAAKAYFARDGRFNGVDAVLFTHVSSNLQTRWGGGRGTGLVSVEYTFDGEAAHGAGAPWRGKSALDAVELMNVGWNFKREHLHYLQRSHYVISDGGDQPNVVPSKASVWYFIREMTAENIRNNFKALDDIASGAALMTGTTKSRRIIGSAWPQNMNKPIAELMTSNIKAVGLPKWSEDDQAFAKAVQKMLGNKETPGLATELSDMGSPPEVPRSGGSDDIGDVSWNVPTVTLRFPSNISGLPGHNWVNGIAMATPIAHKGVVAGAKVMAATTLDLLTKPQLLKDAWKAFEEQTKDIKYEAFISKDDKPAIEINRGIMATYKDALSKLYYDPSKYDTYLDQLGIKYPQLEKPKN